MKTHPSEYGEAAGREQRPVRDRYPRARSDSNYPIVVHSHLGWDWVWQRPQQFLSRFSADHRILFVEAPQFSDRHDPNEPHTILREIPDYPNITILQSQFPARRAGDSDWVDKHRWRALQHALEGELGTLFTNPVHWFYDPMAVTAFAGKLDERAIVYDCMDQLSQFRGAPPDLVERERRLLDVADVVFAGGPKIHRAKSRYNGNCHSYGCGVDVEHFSQARRKQTAIPHDISHLDGPVLGFFGVVDERMDYDLIAAVADADPNWHLVMVGPRTKVEESLLPQRPNIHWIGGRDYSQLPAYAKRFDVCLMPFALNEATEYINPTKALEYMATGRPIVSTPIDDVVDQFSAVTAIAHSPRDFIGSCRKMIRQPDATVIQRGIEMAGRNSWEAIVARLKGHIDEALVEKRNVGAVSL